MSTSTPYISTPITSIQDLITFLNAGAFQQVTDQLEDVRFNRADFEPYIHWDSNRYTRNCIARTDDYELVLLCWQPGQKTGIHCHDDKECWVKVLQGDFQEETYFCEGEAVDATGTRMLAPFEVTSATEATFLHSLQNTSTYTAMTLHLYMKPIDKCRIYCPESKKMTVVDMIYDTYGGKPVE